MNNISDENYKKFYSRYFAQNISSSNSRVYTNTFARYSPLNYSDEFSKVDTEVRQLYELTLFDKGFEQLVRDTTEYNELMNWIMRDPAALKVYEQFKIMKVLGE
jgi:hypothetical protein